VLKNINIWNESNVKHLLSRTMFGYRQDDITFALSLTLDDFIDNYLLGDTAAPLPPASWVNDPPDWQNVDVLYQRYLQLISWQYEVMRMQTTSFREKVVHFFTNHFVSEAEKVEVPQFLYHQNVLFRNYAFGNFKNLS